MTTTSDNQSRADLFSPIRISGLTVKNRIIMPALVLNYSFTGVDMGEDWSRFYHRRAIGGAGMIIVGTCYVDLAGKQDAHQLGVDHNEWIPALEKIAQAIKSGGAVPALQLNHAGRYAKKSISGIDPVAPSAIASRYTKEVPRELSSDEVEGIIDSFAAGARRAQLAGFEAVELLGATGYLISQFLSPLTNQRTDRFGGTEENRRTFAKEIIAAIKETVGPDFPLIFRQSSTDNMPGGMDADDQLNLAKALKEWGVHLINVTAGWHDAPVHQIGPSVPHGHFIPYATRIREAVNLPVACAVRITTPDLASRVIAEKKLDMVTIARALIADPDWPKKAQAGDDESIRYCICCCNCFDRAFARERIECSINPALDDGLLEPAKIVKRILVIGAGPAGMEAARTLARRGHQVTVLEKNQPGGRLGIAARPPHKSEIGNLVQFHVHELKSLHVPIVGEVDFSALAANYDGVVLSAGAEERTLAIKGMENIRIYSSTQVLDGSAVPEGPIVVVGAGEVGCETADYLSALKYDVSIVEIQARPLPDMGITLRWVLLNRLKQAGVNIYTSSSVAEIKPGTVVVQAPDKTLELEARGLILAVGFRAVENAVMGPVKRSGLPHYVIGDQKFPRRIKDAIHEGYRAGTTWVDNLA